MKADRLKTRTGCRWQAVIAVAVLSSLVACGKQQPPAPAASADNEVTAAPSAPQVVQSGAESAPVVAMEKPTKSKAKNADEALAATVKSKLDEAGLGALAVDVVSLNGVVSLYGTVDSPKTREEAARVASSVGGVKSVSNGLVVVHGS